MHSIVYIPSDHIIFPAHSGPITFNLGKTHIKVPAEHNVPTDHFLIPADQFLIPADQFFIPAHHFIVQAHFSNYIHIPNIIFEGMAVNRNKPFEYGF